MMTFSPATCKDRPQRKMASMLSVYEHLHQMDSTNFHYLYALLERYAALDLMDRLHDRFRILIGAFYASKVTREQVVTAARFVARQLRKREHSTSLNEFKHFLWRESQEIAAIASPHLATI